MCGNSSISYDGMCWFHSNGMRVTGKGARERKRERNRKKYNIRWLSENYDFK